MRMFEISQINGNVLITFSFFFCIFIRVCMRRGGRLQTVSRFWFAIL